MGAKCSFSLTTKIKIHFVKETLLNLFNKTYLTKFREKIMSIQKKQIKKMISSYVGENDLFEKLMLSGEGNFDTFDGALKSPFTAHPKIDPDSGEWYSFSTEFRSGSVHHAVLSKGKLRHYSKLFEQKPALAFLHDYFLTENFLVFCI